jgi:hypothetical protein
MTTKTDIAKQASKAAYIAVINAPVKKVAGTKFQTPLTRTDIAKLAATETYKAVMAQDFGTPDVIKTQPLGQYPIDFHSISKVLSDKAPNFFTYLTTNEYLRNPNVPTDLANFMNYVNAPGAGKEKWATPENKGKIIEAIASMVDPEIKQEFATYLQSL